MEGFTKTAKMQCFKSGGSVQKQVKDFTRRDRKSVEPDVVQDKALVKKGVKQHEAALHEGEPKTALKLKCGGRAKKDVGTVSKYKAGGSVSNVYGTKKDAADRQNIGEVKRIKAGKLCDGGMPVKKAEGGIMQAIKAAGTKLKDNVMGTPEQNRMAQARMDAAKAMKGQGAISDAERNAASKYKKGGCAKK